MPSWEVSFRMSLLAFVLACLVCDCLGFAGDRHTFGKSSVDTQAPLRVVEKPSMLLYSGSGISQPFKSFAFLLLARTGWRLTRGGHFSRKVRSPAYRLKSSARQDDSSNADFRAVAAPGSVGAFAEGQNLDELFDILQPPPGLGVLDPNSVKYVGRSKPRGEIHHDGDWHRSIHLWAVIRRENGSLETIFQKRALTKDTHPGLWDVSVAGHIDAGALPLQTVLREVEEEIGIVVSETSVSHIFTIAAEARGSTEKHGAFCCREVQDVYLLELSEVDAESIRYSTGEVAELRSMPVLESLALLRSRDKRYVPRTIEYVEALAQGLTKFYPSLDIA